jgi:hypothetical protein
MFEAIRLNKILNDFTMYSELSVYDYAFEGTNDTGNGVANNRQCCVTKISNLNFVSKHKTSIKNELRSSIFHPFRLKFLVARVIAAHSVVMYRSADTTFTDIFKYHEFERIFTPKLLKELTNKLIYDMVHYPNLFNGITHYIRFSTCIVGLSFRIAKNYD